MTRIYKLLGAAELSAANSQGRFEGSEVDRRDGYIHFSTGAQVRETAAKHFARRIDLILLGLDAEALGDALRWEPSRGGDLFPHLYGALDLKLIDEARALPLGPDGAPDTGETP